MIKLTAPMTEALHFFARLNEDAEAVLGSLYTAPRGNTIEALIRRGLLTPRHFKLTADGWAFLRAGVTLVELHELALTLNDAITVNTRVGQETTGPEDAGITQSVLVERITARRAVLDACIGGYEGNQHELIMIGAHAFWLALYRAEQDRRSRELAVSAYVDAVTEGLARLGRLEATLLVEIHQAAQDLLHGEALEQFRAERPVKGCSCGSSLPSWECELLSDHRQGDALDELVADIQAAEARGDVTPEGGVILRPIGSATFRCGYPAADFHDLAEHVDALIAVVDGSSHG